MKKIMYIIFAGAQLLVFSCEKMNDKHDKYLAGGETVYIGKVDMVKSFAGDNRIKFRYWLSDPRAKSLKIYWANNKDSISVPVTPHSAKDSFEIIIGNSKTIAENNYTFQWISWDDKGNKSVVFENNASVYGDRYRSNLTNKIVSSMTIAGADMTVNWASPTNADDIGVEMYYTDNDNNPVTAVYSNTDMVYEVEVNGIARNRYKLTLENVDFTKGVRYRTLYLPEPTAIDTFYSEQASIEIIQPVNVALGKTATSSDDLNASLIASNVVDGLFTDASRWVSTAAGEHWVEIDLGEDFLIDGFKTWNGSSGQFNTPIPKFDFQVWFEGAWKTIVAVEGNANAQYGANFTPLTTNKVRLYSYSQTRLFEIEVYSTVKY